MHKISVVMPVFNGEKYLKDAIESILSQTYQNFEFIIVDDASSDETPVILEKYRLQDLRIRILKNKKNEGIIISLQKAIGDAHGEYVARMDCDDISLPERLQKQLNFMEENKDVGLLGSAAYVIDENNNITGIVKWPASDTELRRMLIKLCPFFHPSVFIRKKVFDVVGTYDSKFQYAEDYELWLRISKVFKLANLSEPLIKYKVLREGSIAVTKHRESKLSSAKAQWSAIKDGFYPLSCLFYVIKNILMLILPNPLLNLTSKLYYKRIIIPLNK